MEEEGLIKWTKILSERERHRIKNAWMEMPVKWRQDQTKIIACYTTITLNTIQLSMKSIMEKLIAQDF